MSYVLMYLVNLNCLGNYLHSDSFLSFLLTLLLGCSGPKLCLVALYIYMLGYLLAWLLILHTSISNMNLFLLIVN